MNQLTSRQRQTVYLAGILVLLVPIIGLSGVVDRMRRDYGLGEASLGKVDPASATMNLVLLGLRGIATNLLWMQADHEKETKNWGQLESTVESIILLQPHFQSVWKFQAWNLGFNVSAECDNVEDRYFWVKKGMKFIMLGTERNEKVPELYHDAGDYFGNKIGRSDEREYFRVFFLHDPDTDLWLGGPDRDINPHGLDNYLVAREWYQQANDVVDTGVEQHKMALPLFMAYPYRAQMFYANALQQDGSYGEVTLEAWATAYREWTTKYGRREFDTPGGRIRFESTPAELTQMAEEDEVSADEKIEWHARYQNMVNYRFWRLRCEVEQKPEMAQARRAFAEGRRLYREEQDLTAARETLYYGLAQMQTVVDQYRQPDGTSQLMNDEGELAEDIIKAILIWQEVTRLSQGSVPEEFPMDEVWTDPRYEGAREELTQKFIAWIGQG
jgi:hypothetical protein